MTTARPAIVAAVCTWQRYDMLAEALASLAAQSLPAERFEILVVDNSPDAVRSAAEARPYAHRTNLRWHHEKRPGLSHARNVATAITDAPLVAFLDDDACADPGWLAAMIAAFDALGPQAMVIGGRIRPRWGAARPAWLHDALVPALTVVDLGPVRRPLRPGEWVAGANIAFRREALLAHGGFAVNLGRIGGAASLLSNDETDLIERIAEAGGIVAYDPAAAVDHFVPPERLTRHWFRRRMAWQAVSDYLRKPEAHLARRDAHWQGVKDFLLDCPPADRSLRGLALESDDPDHTRRQVGAVYDAVISLLAGLEERDGD